MTDAFERAPDSLPALPDPLHEYFLSRREPLADAWFLTLTGTSYISQKTRELRVAIEDLADCIISSVITVPVSRTLAQSIGATVVQLGYDQGISLGQTLDLLSQELTAGLDQEHVLDVMLHLRPLYPAVAEGFFQAVRNGMLVGQEQMRESLISARVRVEKALRESQHKLNTVITNVPVILFSLDTNGIFTFAAGRSMDALNPDGQSFIGQSIYEMYPESSDVIENINTALTGKSFTATVETGTMVFETHYAPLRDGDDIVGVLGIAFDITERRQLQLALAEARRQIVEMQDAQQLSVVQQLENELLVQLNQLRAQLGQMKRETSGASTNGSPALASMAAGLEQMERGLLAVVEQIRGGAEQSQPLINADVTLTTREQEVLLLLVAGRTNAQIAEVLGISRKTVEKHIGNAYVKLGINSRVEATAWAARIGLI